MLCLTATTGVFAIWKFAEGAESVETPKDVILGNFEYTAEEILPGGDQNDGPIEIGQNHHVLIDLVLNEDQKGYGLNINDNVLIHQYLKRQPVIYSNQKVSGGNLKFILDPQKNTHGLYYAVEYVSDTLYHCYTFSTNELTTAAGTANEIVVFRTNLEKTDVWRTTTSVQGFSQVKSLRDLDISADPQSIPYTIDVSTFHIRHTEHT